MKQDIIRVRGGWGLQSRVVYAYIENIGASLVKVRSTPFPTTGRKAGDKIKVVIVWPVNNNNHINTFKTIKGHIYANAKIDEGLRHCYDKSIINL